MKPPFKVPQYPTKKHKTGQARVRIDGRDHYLGEWGSPESHEKFRRLVAEYLAAGGVVRPEPGTAPTMTVAELVEQYWAHAQGYYTSASHLDRVRRCLDSLLSLYAGTPAAKFGPLALKAVRSRIMEGGYNRRHVNQRVDCIRLAFRWAASEELLPASVPNALYQVDRLKMGRSSAPEPVDVLPVPEAHVAAVRPLLWTPTRALVDLQLLTGMRSGEATGLRACELDRSGRVDLGGGHQLVLPGIWVYCPAEHKMKYRQRRIVLFGPQAQALLAPFLDRPDDAYLFSAAEATAERMAARRVARKTPCWPSQMAANEAGRARKPKRQPLDRYTTGSYGAAVRAACKRAGITPWHPHQLRHNAGTRLHREFGPEIARILLGHESLQSTRIYVADDLEKAADAMKKAG